MTINNTEKIHGAAILRLLEALGESIPEKYFSLEVGESHSAYLLTGLDKRTLEARQVGFFIKVSGKRRTPWRYSFHSRHQDELKVFKDRCGEAFVIFANGDDGFTCLDFDQLKEILDEEHEDQEWVSVSRQPRQAYRVSGNDGNLNTPVPRNAFPDLMVGYFERDLEDERPVEKRKIFSFRNLAKSFSRKSA